MAVVVTNQIQLNNKVINVLYILKLQITSKFVYSATQRTGFVHLFLFREPAMIRMNDQEPTKLT